MQAQITTSVGPYIDMTSNSSSHCLFANGSVSIRIIYDSNTVQGSFFQPGNNSGNRDTVAFHGACIECNMNVDAMGISIATLKCLAFQTYMTLHV